MKLAARIDAFCRLGDELRHLSAIARKGLAEKARNENPWFIEESVLLALDGIATLLDPERLTSWANSYSPEPVHQKIIGVAMAGNIPLVGFHDFLSVLISGHRLKAKPSSQDTVLLKHLFEMLSRIEPRFRGNVEFAENLKDVDAIIATGSDNTARYFEYYFRKIPHVIRKNRASCAIVVGEEPQEEFIKLGQDVFSYFGLGCRNVSKIYLPQEFEIDRLMVGWESFADMMKHHKYANNYDYQKSILTLNKEQFYDSGFVLVKESEQFVSPIATVFIERYEDQLAIREKLNALASKLQVIVSAKGWFEGSIPFGKSQFPTASDFADNVDTMKFLLEVK